MGVQVLLVHEVGMSSDSVSNFFKWLSPMQPSRVQAYLRLTLFWNPATALFFDLTLNGLDHFWQRFVLSWVVSQTLASTSFVLITIYRTIEVQYFKLKGLRVPEISGRKIWAFTIIGMFPGLYFGFIVAAAVAPIFHFLWEKPDLSSYRTGFAFGFILSCLFFLWDIWHRAVSAKQDALLQVTRLKSENLQAQLSALTAQMNPHLMFNALNTIASMIPSDPKSAEEVTVRLSELYRGVLESSRRTTHTLAEELQICDSYLAIERFRFGERLRVSVQIDPKIDTSRLQIPALLLQPLVENAVKYGIAPRSAGGQISISAELNGHTLTIKVEDDGVGYGRSTAKSGSGTGLANSKSRVDLTYRGEGFFDIRSKEPSGTCVEIRMPVEL
jgi:two-component system, LytTR family, sensor kinase